ncbi:fibrinogen alpha chain-like isoform X2 [Narcine bancroftii]
MSDPQTTCTEKKWSACTDDDWGPKCPSGCRLEGLVRVKNLQNNERAQEIGRMLEDYSRMFGSTQITLTEAVNSIRQSLDRLGNFGHTYYQLVDCMNSRFTTLQNRINFQNLKLRLLQKRILEQFRSIKMLEVDIDIKMQSCKGSCIQSVIYNIDHEHNAQMEKSLNSLTGMRLDRIVYNKPMHNLSLVKKVDAVTGFKYACHINFKYPKFCEDTYMGLFVLDNIPHDSSSTSSVTMAGPTSKAIDVPTGSIGSIPGGINDTTSEDTPLNNSKNSTKNSDPFSSPVKSETSTEEQHVTTSEDAPLNYSMNSTKNSDPSSSPVKSESSSKERHVTTSENTPLNYSMNSTKNSDPSSSRVNAETSNKEQHVTTSEDTPLNNSMNSTKISDPSSSPVKSETSTEEQHVTTSENTPLNYSMNSTKNSDPSSSPVKSETSIKEQHVTTSVDAPLNYSTNSTKNSDPSSSRVNAETSNKEQHVTTSKDTPLNNSMNSTKISDPTSSPVKSETSTEEQHVTTSEDAPLNYSMNSTKNSDPSSSPVKSESTSKERHVATSEDATLNYSMNSTKNSDPFSSRVNAETTSIKERHAPTSEDAPLDYSMNSTKNSDPFSSRVNADTSTEELHLTKSSVKGILSDSSHYPKIFHSKTGSQSDMKQNFTNNTDSKLVNTFSDSSLPQRSKVFPGNSTYIETGNFSDYSNSQDVDNSDVIDYKKHTISSPESMTELKTIDFYIETPNRNHQSNLEEYSSTMHPSTNSNLFPGTEITGFVTGNLNMEKMHKIKNYIGKDCDDIMQKHAKGSEDGLFRIKPPGSVEAMTVYCDQSTGLGGWMLVQQRMNESVNFNQSWSEYKRGFGRLDDQGQGNIWLGNDALHSLTQKETFLRIELEDWSGNKTYAEYIVNIGSESESYMLNISSYAGDAGDALITGLPVDQGHTSHANMKFSTFDRDNDKWEESCAQFYGGGWWYNNCQAANLNGIYYHGGLYDPRDLVPYEIENGVVWVPFKGIDYSLKVVRMKIRPII